MAKSNKAAEQKRKEEERKRQAEAQKRQAEQLRRQEQERKQAAERQAQEKAAKDKAAKQQQETQRKTALGRDPKKPPLRGEERKEAQKQAGKQPPPKNNKEKNVPTREDNKALYDSMTPEQQARYRKIRANKGVEAANKYLTGTAPAPGQTPPPDEGTQTPPAPPFYEDQGPPSGPEWEPEPGMPFEQLNPEEQMGELGDVGGNIFQRMGQYAQQFDPRTFQQEYDPVFSQEMERARQNVMGQFERRNQRQFEQQRLSVQQQIAERGLDPASPAAQEMMRQQNEREDMARQEAMSAAESAAQGIQSQMYQQATGVATMPGQIAGQFMDPFMAQYQQRGAMERERFGAQTNVEIENLRQAGAMGQLDAQGQQRLKELEMQQQFEKSQQKRQLSSAERIASMSRSGGGGGAPPNPYEEWERRQLAQGQQQQQPNIGASLAQGLATGAAAGMTRGLMS